MNCGHTSLKLMQELGIEPSPPSLSGLEELTRAFVSKVPFENIGKLLSLQKPMEARLPSYEAFVEGIAKRDLGGTCLTNNPYFVQLLRDLGYRAELLSADMNDSVNMHTACRVTVEEKTYLVDTGFGGPFYRPFPVDELPVVLKRGPRSFTMDRDRPGYFRLTVRDNGEVARTYLTKPEARTLDFFEPSLRYSFREGAVFTNCLAITRNLGERMLTLINREFLVRGPEGYQVKKLENFHQIETCVFETLNMPRCPLRQAAEQLKAHAGIDLFQANP